MSALLNTFIEQARALDDSDVEIFLEAIVDNMTFFENDENHEVSALFSKLLVVLESSGISA